MAGILYRCIFCDASHEVAKRADGPVYLRCPTTYRWAWYEARAFEPAGSPAADRVRSARRAGRPATGGRRAAASTRAKAPARRTGRGTAGRPASRKRSGKRGRR